MDKMSEVITFNTEEAAKVTATPVEVKTFKLVSEDDPILREVLPEFDFANPSINPNEFASTLVETCKKHDGYGLSANQCGFKHRVFVVGAVMIMWHFLIQKLWKLKVRYI